MSQFAFINDLKNAAIMDDPITSGPVPRWMKKSVEASRYYLSFYFLFVVMLSFYSRALCSRQLGQFVQEQGVVFEFVQFKHESAHGIHGPEEDAVENSEEIQITRSVRSIDGYGITRARIYVPNAYYQTVVIRFVLEY